MKRIPIALIIVLLTCASAQAASVDEVLTGLQSYWANHRYLYRALRTEKAALPCFPET